MSRVLLFGKLPAHGDFVARGCSAEERDALDGWLSASLADAHADAGAAFETHYDHAPPWRFVVPAGDPPHAGALALSQDGVGRRFPLFLALRDEAGADAAAACEALLYDAIGGGWDADTLVAHADTLPSGASAMAAAQPRWWTLGGDGFSPAALHDARPPALIAAMLTASDAR